MESTSFNEKGSGQLNPLVKRKLAHFQHIDSDHHHSFINHIYIGISVAISIVVLVGLYILASIALQYGIAIFEISNEISSYRQRDSEKLLLICMVFFMALVIIMSAFCLRFLIRIRCALIQSVEEAYRSRLKELGGDDDR